MMKDLETRFPTPEEIDRHIREGRRMRSEAMRDMVHALARAIAPKRRDSAAVKPIKKGVATA